MADEITRGHTQPPEYSFCETNAAYHWHIRRLTDTGRHLGGGADTSTLCGMTPSWDILCPISDSTLATTCDRCAMAYGEATGQ